MLALSRQCNGFSNRLHLCPGLNAAADFASKLFSQLCQKRFKGHFCQKCIGEIANLVRIANSIRVACCSEMTYKCFVIFSAEPLYFRL